MITNRVATSITGNLNTRQYMRIEIAHGKDRIETAALSRIREQPFVDDAEMSEILSNENLLKRMQKGTREAKLAKGRFVCRIISMIAASHRSSAY